LTQAEAKPDGLGGNGSGFNSAVISPASPGEWLQICSQFASIPPWTTLGLRADELHHSLTIDPRRCMLKMANPGDDKVIAAAIVRQSCAAELLYFRGFGAAIARRFSLQNSDDWTCAPEAGYIASLAVFDAQTGRGLGTQMLLAVHDFLRQQNQHSVFLTVSDFNRNARRFYERHGYEFLGAVDNCIRPGNRENLMYRHL